MKIFYLFNRIIKYNKINQFFSFSIRATLLISCVIYKILFINKNLNFFSIPLEYFYELFNYCNLFNCSIIFFLVKL